MANKKLRTMKLSDEVWSALGIYAERNKTTRTAVVEELVQAYIPPAPTDAPEGQASLFAMFEDGDGGGEASA